jgi:hypothetical protein
MYYCHVFRCYDCAAVEKRIESLLESWKDNKTREMYVMNYDYLFKFVDIICKFSNDEVDMINDFIMVDHEKSLELEPIIVPPMTEFDGIPLYVPAEFLPAPTALPTVQMTEVAIYDIVLKMMREKSVNGSISRRDLDAAIRAALPHGKKCKYRSPEWIIYQDRASGELHITIT